MFISRRIIPVTITLYHNVVRDISKEESKESELMALFNCLVNNFLMYFLSHLGRNITAKIITLRVAQKVSLAKNSQREGEI